MTPRGGDPTAAGARVAELREEIASDLTALRRTWSQRSQWAYGATGSLTARASRLRGLPTWAVGAIAGLLAGVWSALRKPRARSERGGPVRRSRSRGV